VSIEEDPHDEYGERLHPMMRWLGPVVTIAAVWAAREGITIIYTRVAGRPAPVPSDPRTSWKRAFAWTAVTTTTAALIEVTVRRFANEREGLKVLHRAEELG
jgi:hypothetical protein